MASAASSRAHASVPGSPGPGRTACVTPWPVTCWAPAALPEIGQVLRHRSQLSTATYAKIDRSRLGELARPWPGGPR